VKHLFLINPAAGKKDSTAYCKAQINAHCAGLNYEILVSQKPGDLTRFAREAAETGEEIRIYACGGDGTLNEVVCGAAGHSNVSVTSWPAGSGNDFVKIFSDPARFRDLSALLDAEETAVDLIRCGDRYSINICSIGIDARISAEMSTYKKIPLLSGFGAYALSTLVNVIKGIHEPYTVEIDGETIDGNQTLICVCSGRYYGGGFNPVPDADPDDGVLDVLMIRPVSRVQVASLIGDYKAGKYRQLPEWIRHFRTERVTVHCRKDTVVNLDGESIWNKDITFEVCPKALRFFYPRGLTYRYAEGKQPAAL